MRHPLRYTLRQLEYFVAAGETGSVKLASEAVNISQPAISSAIHHLENLFGVQLFLRHHAQGLSLTSAGERLLREARTLLDHAGELSTVAHELGDAVAGPLAVGCLLTLAPVLIPEVIAGFGGSHPQVRVRFAEDHHGALLESLRRGALDAALTYDLGIPEDTAFEALATLPPCALLPGGHRLAGQAQIELAALAGEPFVLLDLPSSREYFLGLFERDGLQPQIAARSPQPDVIRSLVAAGQGFGLVNVRPRNSASLNGRPLAYVPLAPGYRPMVLGVATARGLRKTRRLAAFEAWCRDTFPHPQA
ncbi:MAG: LysR family transcriptional regulator [Burkholderiales bacterium]|nr:LysR family transcriptional regulator [Burkholderiales bacterium]